MIELKLQFANFAELAAFTRCVTEPALSGAVAPGIATTLSPAAQQAARDSTAPGKEAKAKADKAPKEAKAPETTPPRDDKLVDAIVATSTTTLPTYEQSGVAPLITKAQTQDVEATKALLRELGAVDPATNKLKGSFMPPANFATAIEKLTAIIGTESLE